MTSPISPRESQPSSSLQVGGEIPSSTNAARDIALERLNNSLVGENHLLPKSIKATPSGRAWLAIKNFFNRRFSPITDQAKKESKEIKSLIGEVEQVLRKESELNRENAKTEKLLARGFPDEQSTSSSAEYSNQFNDLLNRAKVQLRDLKEQEATALLLAEKHTAFDDLPEQIKKLEKQVDSLEAKKEVLAKLNELELAMKGYYPDEKWNHFMVVKQARGELVKTLREVCLDNSALKDEGNVKHYLSKNTWYAEDVHQLIKSHFPGLKNRMERLLDGSIRLQNNRIEKLDQRVENLKSLFEKYNSNLTRIFSLERSIQDNSLIGRIYRIFHSKRKLRKQIQQIQAEQQNIYKEIKRKGGNFQTTELQWIEAMGKYRSDLIDLRRNIEAIRDAIPFLDVKHHITTQMHTLQQHLEIYHHFFEENTNNTLIDMKTIEMEKIKENAIQTITTDIQELAVLLPLGIEKPGELPSNFAKMDYLNKLKTLITVSFPAFSALQLQKDIVFRLIDRLSLQEKLTEAMRKREKDESEGDESKLDQVVAKLVTEGKLDPAILKEGEEVEENAPPRPNLLIDPEILPSEETLIEGAKEAPIPPVIIPKEETRKDESVIPDAPPLTSTEAIIAPPLTAPENPIPPAPPLEGYGSEEAIAGSSTTVVSPSPELLETLRGTRPEVRLLDRLKRVKLTKSKPSSATPVVEVRDAMLEQIRARKPLRKVEIEEKPVNPLKYLTEAIKSNKVEATRMGLRFKDISDTEKQKLQQLWDDLTPEKRIPLWNIHTSTEDSANTPDDDDWN